MSEHDGHEHLAKLASLENLAESLGDREAGALFQSDLEEARILAARDPRFEELARGLEARSLGERMSAVDRFFKGLEPAELAALELPQNLAQLRAIFLESR